MLWTIFVILLILWLLGFSFHVAGGLIHLLLVIAVVVLIVNLVSPDGSVDPIALSNYAYLQVVDPLKRLPGVGDIQIFGERRRLVFIDVELFERA